MQVILTTNFDRLVEQALDAVGVAYQVISSGNAVDGIEPIAHAKGTVVKLHGDYISPQILNTVTRTPARLTVCLTNLWTSTDIGG